MTQPLDVRVVLAPMTPVSLVASLPHLGGEVATGSNSAVLPHLGSPMERITSLPHLGGEVIHLRIVARPFHLGGMMTRETGFCIDEETMRYHAVLIGTALLGAVGLPDSFLC